MERTTLSALLATAVAILRRLLLAIQRRSLVSPASDAHGRRILILPRGRPPLEIEQTLRIRTQRVMDKAAGTHLALFGPVKPLLEAKVIELSLEARILGMAIVPPQNLVLQPRRIVHDDLADAGLAPAPVRGLVEGGDDPAYQIAQRRIQQHGVEMAEKFRHRVRRGRGAVMPYLRRRQHDGGGDGVSSRRLLGRPVMGRVVPVIIVIGGDALVRSREAIPAGFDLGGRGDDHLGGSRLCRWSGGERRGTADPGGGDRSSRPGGAAPGHQGCREGRVG
mmetsp:Transcript_33414/g.70231  ORF Transcript_33414/g.70231 Transcript_33414/m.70231 type:complete len:278 (+) Transcript_33414:264-1097(+)